MSGIGTGTALAIAGGVSAAGAIGGAAIGANAAGNAASTQANAADYAANLQYQASQNALGFQEGQWNTAQQEMMPFLNSGYGALSNLDYLMGVGNGGQQQNAPGGAGVFNPPQGGPNPTGGPAQGPTAHNNVARFQGGPGGSMGGPDISGNGSMIQSTGGGPNPTGSPIPRTNGGPTASTPPGWNPNQAPNTNLGAFGSLMSPYGQTFSAPTEAQMEANDPGYQARMKMGQQAFEQSAAARGNVLTGGTAQAENQLAQDYASNEYQNYYNQSYNTYANNYNQWAQNQARQYNQLASMAGLGQTAAGQLGTLGQGVSNSITGNLLGTAQGMGQAYQNAAAANASGMVGSANAWGGALGGVGGNLSQLMMLNQLYGQNGGGSANYIGGTIPTNELNA